MTGLTAQRSARFDELAFDQDGAAELLGPGCTGQPWARVPCSSGLAMGGGEVRFDYPGDPSELVRMSPQGRRSREAYPEHVRVTLRGEELRRWPLNRDTDSEPLLMLPGDSLTVHI